MRLPDLTPNGIPSNQDLHYLYSLEVLDQTGQKVIFGTLFHERTLVVFLRSCVCEKCTLYLSQLSRALTPAKLLSAGLRVVVVGCRGSELIKALSEITSCPFPIYYDPTHATYLKLGCSWTLDTSPKAHARKKASLRMSTLSGAFGAIKFGLSTRSSMEKAGDMRQNGGEFIFGPGVACSFAHRMQNSEDHTDLDQLFIAAGISSWNPLDFASSR